MKWYASVVAAFVAVVVFVEAGTLHAASLYVAESVALNASDTIEGNAYVAAKEAGIFTTTPGDLLAVGGTMLVGGPILHDLFTLAGEVDVRAPIGGDLRVMAAVVSLNEVVSGESFIVGGEVRIGNVASLKGDTTIFADRVVIDGVVGGRLSITARSVEVHGTLMGTNTISVSESLMLSDSAQISGSLAYSAPRTLMLSEDATVAGPITFTQYAPANKSAQYGARAFAEAFTAAHFIGMLITTILAVWLFPHACQRTVRYVLIRGPRALGVGALVLVLGAVMILALLVTVLGMYTGILLLAAALVYVLVAKLVAGMIAGALLAQWVRKEPIVTPLYSALGVVAVWSIDYVPVVGAVTNILLLCAGAGSIAIGVYTLWWRTRQKPLPIFYS
jgi:hypothetical protein